MSRNRFISAIDLGSSHIRVMISELAQDGEDTLRIIGVGEAPSFGMRKGIVSDGESLAKSVSEAIEKAESMAGVSLRDAIVSIGGTNVRTQEGKGVIAVAKADGEVTHDDIDRVLKSAGKVDIPLNYEIIHIIPRSYRLDDQKDIQDPVGMQGVRLEVDTLIVVGFSPQIKQIQNVMSSCGVNILQFVFTPLASAQAILDREQKELGVAVIDLGAMTTGLAVYEEGELLYCSSLNIGASSITSDIAIGLRTSISLAERVKVEYGTANLSSIDRSEEIQLDALDPSEEGDVSRYHVGEIIEARLEEILEKMQKELTSIDRDHLLPAGIILCGGGANIPEIIDLTKRSLALPVSLGYPRSLSGIVDKVDDPSYAVVAGLIRWQWEHENEGGTGSFFQGNPLFRTIVEKFREWFQTFLP